MQHSALTTERCLYILGNKKGVSLETPSNNTRLIKDVCQLGRAKQRQGSTH